MKWPVSFLCRKTDYSESLGSFSIRQAIQVIRTGVDDRNRSVSHKGTRWYTLSDVEKYKPLSKKYMEEDLKIRKYQRKCKDEALALFSKGFYDLWD